MNTIKEKEFHDAQEYISSKEWKEVKKEIDTRIIESRDYIIEDALTPQPLVYSRNIMRGKGKVLALELMEKISNEHLKKVIHVCIVQDNEERLLTPTEESNDIIKYSDKDWLRRERRILQYISDFDKVY